MSLCSTELFRLFIFPVDDRNKIYMKSYFLWKMRNVKHFKYIIINDNYLLHSLEKKTNRKIRKKRATVNEHRCSYLLKLTYIIWSSSLAIAWVDLCLLTILPLYSITVPRGFALASMFHSFKCHSQSIFCKCIS